MGGFKCVKQIKYYTVRDSIMITTSLCGGYFLQSLLEWSGPDQHVGIACCTSLVPRLSPCPLICFYFLLEREKRLERGKYCTWWGMVNVYTVMHMEC